MRIEGRWRRLGAALTAGAAAVVAAGGAATRSASADGGLPAGSCAWYTSLNTNGANALALDSSVTYWVTRVPHVPGESLTIRGRYPHARYMSLTAYDPRTRAVSSLYDGQIQPDPGSTNPFADGADRGVRDRTWTVSVRFLNPGDTPSADANVLSTGFLPGAAAPAADYFLVYRVYLPDDGADRGGNVGLPAVAANLPLAGQVPFPGCPAGFDPGPQANDAVASAGFPAATPADSSAAQPVWHRFYNAPTSAAGSPDSSGRTNFAGTAGPATMATGQGGYLEDLENAYLYAFVNLSSAPLVVIHAAALSYPDTSAGTGPMPAGRDVRYWSVCTYDAPTQRNHGCAAGHQAAPSGGDYTLVISTPANRPANLCGAGWLPFGPGPQALLIFRNQLGVAPTSVQHVRLGHETDMGVNYPSALYMDQGVFATNVCHTAGPTAGGGPLGAVTGPAGDAPVAGTGGAGPGAGGAVPGGSAGQAQAGAQPTGRPGGYQPVYPVVGDLGTFGDWAGGIGFELGAMSGLDLGVDAAGGLDAPGGLDLGTAAGGLGTLDPAAAADRGGVAGLTAVPGAANRGNAPLGISLGALILGALGVAIRARLVLPA